jgi:probable HAF family extracellular repeat protein
VVIGGADTPTPDPFCIAFNFDCFVSHAFKWQGGILTDLGVLPGGNNSYATLISANGLVAGVSQNGEIDPLIGVPETRAAFWRGVNIHDLGTLGGNESFAGGVNTRGQVVGVASNAIPDTYCYFGWGVQCHAFLWQNGVMRDLGTLGGTNSAGSFVNEAGEVAGWSDTSSTPNQITGLPPNHPFLWKDGKMRDLGTIGGTQIFELNALNERGQVVGQMTLADEQRRHAFLWDGKKLIDLGTFGGDLSSANGMNNAGDVTGYAQYAVSCPEGGAIAHAYLWRNGVMTDLGIVAGINPLDGGSTGWSINSKTQIVGIVSSCDFSIADAFLWDNGGPMINLNTLIPAESAMHLFWGLNINDRGEIAGLGLLPNGDVHAFLLVPCGNAMEGCGSEATSVTAPSRSNSILTLVQRSAIRKVIARSRRLGMR